MVCTFIVNGLAAYAERAETDRMEKSLSNVTEVIPVRIGDVGVGSGDREDDARALTYILQHYLANLQLHKTQPECRTPPNYKTA